MLQEGVIVVNINVKNYQETLKGIFPSDYENLYLFNEEGESLFSWTDNIKSSDEFLQAAGMAGKSQYNDTWMKVNDTKYLFNRNNFV